MEVPTEADLRRHILIFLKDFKELMGQGHYFVKDHHKNIQTLKDLGITTRIRDDLILSIALSDYSSGPNPDEYQPGFFWVFGKDLNGIEIYIKLKIVTRQYGYEKAVCISFHSSEHPLRYPLRM